jgi:hypothetical protein
MWLSSWFWGLTGANRQQLANVPWLQVFEQTPNVTKINAADTCFTTDEGDIGEPQLKLRSLLFPLQVLDRLGEAYPPSSTRH